MKTGFSKSQHAWFYRPMVDAAWQRHAALNRVNAKDRAEKEKWYREQLHARLGVFTTKECDPKGDFEKLMAHFEAIAENGIKWQLRLEGGTTRRLLYSIRSLCAEHDLEESYVRGLAKQMLGRETLPVLAMLSPGDLLVLLKGLRKDAARLTVACGKAEQRRGAEAQRNAEGELNQKSDNEPF